MRHRTHSSFIVLLGLGFLFPTVLANASFMGRADFWVQFTGTGKMVAGKQNLRQVSFRIVHWGRGGGHLRTFGKQYVGRTFNVKMEFPSRKAALAIKNDHHAWVFHRSVSSMMRDPKTGRRRAHSSRYWRYTGQKLPIVQRITDWPKGKPVPKSYPVKVLWAMRHGDQITLQLEINSRHDKHRIHLYWKNVILESLPPQTYMDLVCDVGTGHQYNKDFRRSRLCQFTSGILRNKKVYIRLNGKVVATFKPLIIR